VCTGQSHNISLVASNKSFEKLGVTVTNKKSVITKDWRKLHNENVRGSQYSLNVVGVIT
jgi:hypothetical protein